MIINFTSQCLFSSLLLCYHQTAPCLITIFVFTPFSLRFKQMINQCSKIYAKRTAKVMLFLFLTKIFKKKFLLPNLKYLIFLHARLMVISFYFHNRRRFNPSHHFLLLILSLSISRKRVQKYSFFI